MKQFLVLFKKEMLELMRSRKFMILGVVFVIFAVLSVITAKITPQLLKSFSVPGMSIDLPEPTYLDSADQFFKNNGQLLVFILIFVVSGVIADEKIKHTLEIILAKPVSRVKFVLAKFSAVFLTIFSVYLLSSLLFYFYTVSVFSSFNLWYFIIAALLGLIWILVVAVLTLFGSAWTNSGLKAAGIGFIGMIVLTLLPALLPKFAKYFPNYIYGTYRDLMVKGWDSSYVWGLATSLIIIVVFVCFSAYIFKNQEIDRK
jgi:ABC-2 type transport system permease protein